MTALAIAALSPLRKTSNNLNIRTDCWIAGLVSCDLAAASRFKAAVLGLDISRPDALLNVFALPREDLRPPKGWWTGWVLKVGEGVSDSATLDSLPSVSMSFDLSR